MSFFQRVPFSILMLPPGPLRPPHQEDSMSGSESGGSGAEAAVDLPELAKKVRDVSVDEQEGVCVLRVLGERRRRYGGRGVKGAALPDPFNIRGVWLLCARHTGPGLLPDVLPHCPLLPPPTPTLVHTGPGAAAEPSEGAVRGPSGGGEGRHRQPRRHPQGQGGGRQAGAEGGAGVNKCGGGGREGVELRKPQVWTKGVRRELRGAHTKGPHSS